MRMCVGVMCVGDVCRWCVWVMCVMWVGMYLYLSVQLLCTESVGQGDESRLRTKSKQNTQSVSVPMKKINKINNKEYTNVVIKSSKTTRTTMVNIKNVDVV